MATVKQRITNCMWFDSQAEEAANFYTSVFQNSKVGKIARYGKAGFEFYTSEIKSDYTIVVQGIEIHTLNPVYHTYNLKL